MGGMPSRRAVARMSLRLQHDAVKVQDGKEPRHSHSHSIRPRDCTRRRGGRDASINVMRGLHDASPASLLRDAGWCMRRVACEHARVAYINLHIFFEYLARGYDAFDAGCTHIEDILALGLWGDEPPIAALF